MSSKSCSLAIEEIKEQSHHRQADLDFEPQLEVLVNKRLIKNSNSAEDQEIVRIGGRITISF